MRKAIDLAGAPSTEYVEVKRPCHAAQSGGCFCSGACRIIAGWINPNTGHWVKNEEEARQRQPIVGIGINNLSSWRL